MKLIPLLLLAGMFAVSGWAEIYSPELVKKAEGGDDPARSSPLRRLHPLTLPPVLALTDGTPFLVRFKP